jgi:hypothetical protein
MSVVTSHARNALDELHDLAELSEKLLENELEALSVRVEDKVCTLDSPEKEDELAWYNDDFYRLSIIFPRIQRYALFTATMSAIEYHLYRMCKVAQQIGNHSLSLKDLSGRGIVRSLAYLTKVCGYKISQETDSEAYDLKMYQKIRNVIIHADGLPKNDELKAIKPYQKHNPTFELNESDRIVLSAIFSPIVICRAEELFEIIAGEMRKRVKVATFPPVE